MTIRKTLLVDWGGVLTVPLEYVWKSASARNAQQATATRAVIDAWLEQDRKLGAGTSPLYLFETGRIDLRQFEFELQVAWETKGYRGSAEGFVQQLMSPLGQANERIFDVLGNWRDRGVRLAVASNSWGDLYDRTRWDIFDEVFISGEQGVRKPDPAFFKAILDALDAEPCSVGLIDDMAHNVRSANELGIKGFHFTDTTTVQIEVEQWLAGDQS